MTSPTSTQVAKRKRVATRHRTPFGALAEVCGRIARESTELRWPSPRYREAPEAFAREILGDTPWSRQVEILEAVRDHDRVAVASGHKIGKSRIAAVIALWFFCSFPDARVVMSSTTARQVDQILWRELRMLAARAPVPVNDSPPYELARSGLKSSDFREIVGFTARESEAVAGVSGANLLYIVDEASGVPDTIFEAIEGNRAGGARLLMFSNPTRTEGVFYEAFHTKARFYRTLTVSSAESPNVLEGRVVIPGLATRDWCERMKDEHGEDSPFYKVRVLGQFVLKEDGKVLSIHAITQAEERWHDLPEEGRLYVGIDPAGPGQGGDESVFAVRRGLKLIALYAFRGLKDDGHLAHLNGILAKHRKPNDPVPAVVVDREGPIGGRVFGTLRGYVEAHEGAFAVVGVRSSDRAVRQPFVYDRVKDELWANLADWLKDGGGIPEDVKLSKELHVPEWDTQVNGRLKVTSKDEMRKVLGRSPDRADAVALSVWTVPDVEVVRRGTVTGRSVYDAPTEIDPYTLDGMAGRDPVYG